MAFATVCLIGSVVRYGELFFFDPFSSTYYYSPSEDKFHSSIYSIDDTDERDIFNHGQDEKARPDGVIVSSRPVTLDKISAFFIVARDPKDPEMKDFLYWIWKYEKGLRRLSDIENPSGKIKARIVELTAKANIAASDLKSSKRNEALEGITAIGIGLPFAILAFGAALGWILQGFRSKEPK